MLHENNIKHISTRTVLWLRHTELRETNSFPYWTACDCIRKKLAVVMADAVMINYCHKNDFVFLLSQARN